MSDQILAGLVASAVALPLLGFVMFALPAWFGARFGERFVAGSVGLLFTCSSLASGLAFLALVFSGRSAIEVPLGEWFSVGSYGFHWTLIGDRLSLPFAWFAAMLVGLMAAFSRRYLHREAGFFRFYLMLVLFGTGVELVVLAGSLDLVFVGWELVGITSALLIAFFHERPKPVEHGLRAFITYRLCDVGLLSAVVWLHHAVGHTDFVSGQPWLQLAVPSEGHHAVWVGFLLLFASMGKSAQVPLGGWLPRAMEGPTPSSAIFYGAIAIHLGPYLLLRAGSILDQFPAVAWTTFAIGSLTALHGSIVGRVQTDIKSSLAYGSMTQVGLIVAEIGLGLRVVPLVHIIGHAAIRSLEILRSPSLLHDHHYLEEAVGTRTVRTPRHSEGVIPRGLRSWLYRYALERGYQDGFLREVVVGSFLRFAAVLGVIDSALTGWIGGRDAVEEERPR